MSSKINALIERFNNELNLIEQEAVKGLEVAKNVPENCSNHYACRQASAFFNNVLFFVNLQKTRIQIISNKISFLDDFIDGKQQIFAKLLDNELEQILEVKKMIKNIISDLKILK